MLDEYKCFFFIEFDCQKPKYFLWSKEFFHNKKKCRKNEIDHAHTEERTLWSEAFFFLYRNIETGHYGWLNVHCLRNDACQKINEKRLQWRHMWNVQRSKCKIYKISFRLCRCVIIHFLNPFFLNAVKCTSQADYIGGKNITSWLRGSEVINDFYSSKNRNLLW